MPRTRRQACPSGRSSNILIGDLLGAIDDYTAEPLIHSPAGQGIVQFKEETTVAAIIRHFVADAERALAAMPR